MAVPIALLLIGSGLALVPARRIRRFLKAIAVGAALAAWIASIGLAREVPAGVSLSVWRPEELFGDRIALSLDISGWMVGFGLVSALVAALLHDARGQRQGGVPLAGLLAFAAIGLAAVQAGNLLTLTLTWALLDVLGLVLVAPAVGGQAVLDRRWRGRLLTSAAGLLVAISAVIGLGGDAAGSGLGVLATRPLAAGIFTLGLVIRLAGSTLPVHEADGEEDEEAAGSFLALVPIAACAAALARVGPVTEGPVAWLMAALGLGGLVYGCLRWPPQQRGDVTRALPFLGIGLVGVGALGSAAHSGAAQVTWSTSGALILLVGMGCVMAGPSSWVGRASALLAALVVAGLPFSLGARLVSPFVVGDEGVGRWVMGGLVAVGLAALASGVWQLASDGEGGRPKLRGGGLAAWAAWLFLLTAMFAGYAFLSSQAGAVGQTGSLVTLALLIAGVLVRRRWIPRRFHRLSRIAKWLDPRLAIRSMATAGDMALRAARGVAELVEGEAAMLWIYVILVALGAAAAVSR